MSEPRPLPDVSSHHLPGLDLLRAVAVLWTMFFHSFLVGGLGENWSWLSRFGWMGVDLFFVLSGFLIGSQVLRPLAKGDVFSFRDFYIRRAFRILPTFFTVLMLYVLWPDFREAPSMEPWWKFAGFFVNLSIDYEHNIAFSHAWSLCVEEHFYLLFPPLALLMLWRPSARMFVISCVGIVGAGIALRTNTWLHWEAIDPSRSWFVEKLYYPTWNRLDGLLAGVMLAVWMTYRPESWARVAARANILLMAGLATMGLSFWLFAERTGLLGNGIGWPVLSLGLALLVFAGAQPNSWIGQRRIPGAAWLAAVSFSLYLVHKPIYGLVHRHFGEALAVNDLLAFASYAIASLLGAAVLYYVVERPGLRTRAKLQRRAGR